MHLRHIYLKIEAESQHPCRGEGPEYGSHPHIELLDQVIPRRASEMC